MVTTDIWVSRVSMAFSLSTSLMRGDLSQKIKQAQRAGFQKIDININDITSCELSLEEIAHALKTADLSVGALLPFYNFEGYEGEMRNYAFKRLHWYLNIARKLNADHLLIGASQDKRARSDISHITRDLKEATHIAQRNGIKLAYLALPWSAHIKDIMGAYQIIKSVNHSAVGLAINSYFALADGSKPARYRDLNGEKIFILQLADAPFSEFDIAHLKHEYACLPALGDLNLKSFLKVMTQIGYKGDVSLARMGQADQNHNARDGYRALSNLIDGTETQFQEKPLPHRAYAKGVEFLEFVVDAQSGEEMRALLTCLCFRIERHHKTKPVELWRQGAINIVLNEVKDGYAHRSLMANGPGLCDMGLRVDNAEQIVKRASALGITIVKQPLGMGELDIPAIEGIGHSLIHFIDENSDLHRVWDIEFTPQAEKETIAPAGLRRIDHIAQTMKADELGSWLLFYLSVFNMKKSPLTDVADPSGVVYSRAVESPEGELRLNLNGARSQQTLSGAFLAERVEAGAQHIAFASDDIFETAARLSEMNFPALPVNANYYDNLQIEFNLDADFVKKMKTHNILYSRNETGEYFQFYSQSLWGGFFIEIVERRGGYSGYGARNAPIRLAAQTRLSTMQGGQER